MNQDTGNTEKSGDKSPELQRVEQYFKDAEARNAALRNALAPLHSAGMKWRFSAGMCFFGAVMSWWFTNKIPASAILAFIGIVLFVIAVVKQKRSEQKQ